MDFRNHSGVQGSKVIEQVDDDSVEISMILQKITYFLIISFVASFFMRISGTLFPAIFQDSYVVRITLSIHAFLTLMLLLFFIFFLISFAKNRELPLKVVTFLAILGSFAVSMLYIKNVGIVFDIEFLQRFLTNKDLSASIPVLNSIFHLLFFIVFKRVLTDDEQSKLARPILAAIVGGAALLVLHLVVLLKFIKLPFFNWSEQMSQFMAAWTLPFMALATLLMLYFYISFYQYITPLNVSNQD